MLHKSYSIYYEYYTNCMSFLCTKLVTFLEMLKIISKKISNRAADPSVNINITANKYLEVDNDLVSTELPTEEDIFEEFLMAEGVLRQHVEEDSNDEEETIISVRTERQALDIVKKFLEQRDFTTENDVKYIRNIIRR